MMMIHDGRGCFLYFRRTIARAFEYRPLTGERRDIIAAISLESRMIFIHACLFYYRLLAASQHANARLTGKVRFSDIGCE